MIQIIMENKKNKNDCDNPFSCREGTKCRECKIAILPYGYKWMKYACPRCGYHICKTCRIKKNLLFYPNAPENTCLNCDLKSIDLEYIYDNKDDELLYIY